MSEITMRSNVYTKRFQLNTEIDISFKNKKQIDDPSATQSAGRWPPCTGINLKISDQRSCQFFFLIFPIFFNYGRITESKDSTHERS